MNEKKLGRRAVVIGGSIAGMLSARVLSKFFSEVVIVEADEASSEIAPRKRIPQGHHSHILLESGQKILERLFPGLIEELIANGSAVTDFTNDLEWFHFGKWKRRIHCGIRGVQQTRPFLEWHINKRLKDDKNIFVQYQTVVTELVMAPDCKRVTGVRTRNKLNEESEEWSADMVVDASGYGSQTLKWVNIEPNYFLEEIKIGLFYATQFFRCDESLGWKNLMISAQLPHSPYGGAVLSFEEGKFGVTLWGYLKEPPKSNDAFLEIAKALPMPHIYEFLKMAMPVSELKVYRIPSQIRKRLDKVEMPNGLIMVGDAFCRFDPIYAQGMSVAALEAELLENELTRVKKDGDWDGFYKSYHRKQFKITKNPWDMAIIEAFRHPGISGKRPFGISIKQRFVTTIYDSSATNEYVYLELIKVMNLTQTPNAFFKPSMWPKLLFQRRS